MPASLDQQVETAALERLRQRENPFSSYVATLDEEQRFDVPELLAEQRRDIKAIIDQFREGNRPSRIYPIVGDPGTGKTHLLASLKRELDNVEQLLVVSEGFPKDRDPADFFLWQIVSLLLAHRKTSMQILENLSHRVTGRVLGETIRRMPPNHRLHLVPTTGFWDGMGRSLGFSGASSEPLKLVQSLLDVCDSDKFAEALPVFWDMGIKPKEVAEAIWDHLESCESSDADGFLRRMIYNGMAHATILNQRDGLVEFLTGGFDGMPEYVAGAGDLPKRLLRVLLEVFATFRIPVVVAFDQLEDFLRAGSAEEEKELKLNFCRGLVALTNAVPNLCVLLFAERGIWNELLTNLDRFSTDRLHHDLGIPGKPSQHEISLPDQFDRDALTAVIRARVRPLLGEHDGKDQLPPLFPFHKQDLASVLQQTSIRGCLQQLGKLYSSLVYSEQVKGASPGEIHEYLAHCWEHHRIRAAAKIENLSAADIPALADAFKAWLDYWAEHHLSDTIPWVANDVARKGHELFGHLNVLRTQADKPGLGIGFWMGGAKHRPTDLAAKLAFFATKPPVIRSLVVLRRDGANALGGVSADHYKKATNKGLDVRVEELVDDDLAVVLCFPQWLKVAHAFIQPHPQQDIGQEAINDVVRERSRLLFDKIQKWLAGPTEGAAS